MTFDILEMKVPDKVKLYNIYSTKILPIISLCTNMKFWGCKIHIIKCLYVNYNLLHIIMSIFGNMICLILIEKIHCAISNFIFTLGKIQPFRIHLTFNAIFYHNLLILFSRLL